MNRSLLVYSNLMLRPKPRSSWSNTLSDSGIPGVGMGLIAAIMETDEYKDLRDFLGLDRFSQVLMFSTEGNTDPMKFRKVLWDGEYPTV